MVYLAFYLWFTGFMTLNAVAHRSGEWDLELCVIFAIWPITMPMMIVALASGYHR